MYAMNSRAYRWADAGREPYLPTSLTKLVTEKIKYSFKNLERNIF